MAARSHLTQWAIVIPVLRLAARPGTGWSLFTLRRPVVLPPFLNIREFRVHWLLPELHRSGLLRFKCREQSKCFESPVHGTGCAAHNVVQRWLSTHLSPSSSYPCSLGSADSDTRFLSTITSIMWQRKLHGTRRYEGIPARMMVAAWQVTLPPELPVLQRRRTS